MKFVDANVFIYAMLEPKHKLSEQEIKLKKNAKIILKKIEEGEKAMISVVHVSEIVNVLSSLHSISLANEFLDYILSTPRLQIIEVEKKIYLLANELSKIIKIGINDCLAYALMRNNKITEIYSFDKDFDKVYDIKRVEK